VRFVFRCAFLVILVLLAPAGARPESTDFYKQKTEYDLPGLPLNEALAELSRKSGFQIFYDFELASAHDAPALVGVFNVSEALTQLLQGTGLMAVLIAPGTISVRKAPLPHHMRQYVEVMHARMVSALCHTHELSKGPYRATVQLRVAADGRVEMSKLLGSSGDTAKATRVVSAFEALALPPPPPSLPQPITLVIELPSNASAAFCSPGQ
jgi:hypothetical protein